MRHSEIYSRYLLYIGFQLDRFSQWHIPRLAFYNRNEISQYIFIFQSSVCEREREKDKEREREREMYFHGILFFSSGLPVRSFFFRGNSSTHSRRRPPGVADVGHLPPPPSPKPDPWAGNPRESLQPHTWSPSSTPPWAACASFLEPFRPLIKIAFQFSIEFCLKAMLDHIISIF